MAGTSGMLEISGGGGRSLVLIRLFILPAAGADFSAEKENSDSETETPLTRGFIASLEERENTIGHTTRRK
ncbi:hypothetical protein SDC9_178740 [bioreactor metagenome]|uniref:Uncharacterized protein n=1 Tax=bioreactor metagenome TaxID=1076179 RepID=A0A645GYD6_9ZZZZ